jgi:hypothetical protein
MHVRNDITWCVIIRGAKSYIYANARGIHNVIGKHYRVITCKHAMINHHRKQSIIEFNINLICMSKTFQDDRKREESHYQGPSSRDNQQ